MHSRAGLNASAGGSDVLPPRVRMSFLAPIPSLTMMALMPAKEANRVTVSLLRYQSSITH